MGLQDKIGREDFVNKICGLVDSLGKDKNFSMAINGAWGSGKTFVLDMIEEKLSERQEYIVIKYDAWENNFYPDPLIAILSCVIDGIDEKLYLLDRKKERAMKAAKSGVNTLAKVSAKIEKLQTVIEGIKNIIKIFHNPIDTAALGDFKSYQKLLKTTKEILNEITQAGEYREKQTKLVILVDEIDRCLPDEQLKVLERLHHLFKVNNCAVIVAMNCKCVSKTVKKIYDMDGSEYLRKFFSLTYKLDTKADTYLLNLMGNIEENVKRFNPNYANNTVMASCGFILAVQKNKKSINTINNREIKEFYECVEKICDEFGWANIKCDHNLVFIILGTYIRRVVDPKFMDSRIGGVDFYGVKVIDYIAHNLLISDQNVIDEINGACGSGDIARRHEYFNDMVYCATCDLDAGSQYIDRKYQTTFNVAECKKLKELILKHAGEKYVDTRETN